MEPTAGESHESPDARGARPTAASESSDAERTARFQKNLCELQIEASPDGIIVVSPSRSIILSNQRFHEIWQISDEVMSTGSDRGAVAVARDRLRDPKGFVARVEWLYAHPDTEAHDELELADGRVLERYSAPVRDRETGVYFGRLWSFRDISNRKLLAVERMARSVAEAAAKRQAILAETGRSLAEGAEDRPIRAVLALLVPYLGSVALFHLYDDGKKLVTASSPPARRADEVAVRILARFAPTAGSTEGAAHAMRREKAVTAAGAPFDASTFPDRPSSAADRSALGTALRTLRLHSYAALPIVCRGETLGAAVFCAETAGFYDETRLELAEQVLARVAIARVGDRLHRAMRDAVTARDEFLSIASHELRSPIAGLQFATDALRRARESGRVTGLPPMVGELVRTSESHIRRIATLVDALLDVTKLRAGRLHLEQEEVDLREVAREVVSRYCAETGMSGCAITLVGETPVIGMWDRARVEQIVDNLASNAVKYGAGKPVTITVTLEGEVARLVVADQGIGIPPDRVGRIFDRFERAVSARAYQGLGLGLYIVGQIVGRLGGRVRVESNLGVGSTFTVELPIAGPTDSTGDPTT